jgi:LacI family transcriptional regulator
MKQNVKTSVIAPPLAHKRRQVAATLREMVGNLAPGDRLPSVNELERHFGVAAGTVEAAMRLLQSEGVIVSRRGSGTFVAPRAAQNGHHSAANGEKTLAVIALRANPFFRHCVDELTAQAAEAGRKVICHYGSANLGHAENIANALELERLHPGGFLVFSYRLHAVAEALQERGHRIVLVGTPPPGDTPQVPCVVGDHETGGHLAARRLITQGHSHIAYLNAAEPERLLKSPRWQGHCRALREAGIPEQTPIIGEEMLAHWRTSPEAVRAWFTRPNAPTAVAAWTDAEAITLISILHRAGLRVPQDISVVGYDNIPMSADCLPPLDTVDPYLSVQIRHALTILYAPSPSSQPGVIVTPALQMRESTARPSSLTATTAEPSLNRTVTKEFDDVSFLPFPAS